VSKSKVQSTGNVSITKSWFNFQQSKAQTAYVDCVWLISTFQRWSWTDCVSCQ